MALVIGNDKYPQMPLRNAVNDARTMAETLQAIGFQVSEREDVSKRGFDRAVDEFVAMLQPGDVGLLYYAGHAVELEGENYLIPVDFQGSSAVDARWDAVPARKALEKIRERGARLRLLVLDACRSNPWSGRGGSGGLTSMGAGEGELIAFATAPKRTASDNPGGRNGLFTEQLAVVLREPGLELRDVFKRVKAAVYRASAGAQLPYVEDGVIGDFVLNSSSASAGMASLVAGPAAAPAPEPAYVPPATAAATEGEVRPNARDGLKYAWIPPGRFEMGCVPTDRGFFGFCSKDEKPQHPVTLTKGFWLAQTEVTVAAYRAFANATGRLMPKAPLWLEDMHPIVNVTWSDAVAFCDWSGGRLPTEAEWEYAARGGRQGLKFPMSDKLTREEANYSGKGGRDVWAKTAPVGSFPPSGFGLYDMAGNAWEWCSDYFAPFSGLPERDPTGPSAGNARVVRSGSWAGPDVSQRASNRGECKPDAADDQTGFRCARDANP